METTNIVDFARRDGMSDARVIVKAMGKMELPNLYRQTQDGNPPIFSGVRL